VSLVNDTGIYDDDEIFVTIIGQTTPGQWAWVDQTGTAHPLDSSAANGPATRRRTASTTPTCRSRSPRPTSYAFRRSCKAAGSTCRWRSRCTSPSARTTPGYTRLNPVSSADPNFETVYDWSELTFQNGSIPFGGNTTQVDQFGMPMLVTLSQTSSGFVGGRGLTLTRAEVFDSYQSTVPEAFQALVVKDGDGNPIRILAPRTAQPGDVATWMDEPVDDLWTKYTSQPFVYNGAGYVVNGGVNGSDQFVYTITPTGQPASGPYTMERPTSAEVFAANGEFTGPGLDGAFLAQLNAAFNRGVASTPDLWDDESGVLPGGPAVQRLLGVLPQHRCGARRVRLPV